MKTYYIPISTLNFNNILSSESISPAAFYSLRTFGIKRWTSVDENSIDTIILLYEEPKRFSRDDSEQEDHPMLIAIQTEEHFPNYSEGVFFSDHTLYLDPWHTSFIFFTTNDKRTTLSLSESSLEQKTLSLYKDNICIRDYTEKYETISHPSTQTELKKVSAQIDKDTRINKLKGLLYGYYVGAYLSSSEENINDLWAFQRVHAYLANYISNNGKCPINISNVEFFERHISNENHRYLQTGASEIVLQDDEIISLKLLDEDKLSLFKEWVGKVFLKPEYDKNIIPLRDGILNDIINVTNEYCNKKIAQQAKNYFNNLQDQFDGIYTNKLTFNSGMLSSLALVLLAGDSWEKLLQVMQRNRLYDYRLAFAIFGCICGFADLYRTFTDYLLDCKDKQYVADMYVEFYGQLFGKSLDTSHQMELDDKIQYNPNERNDAYSTITAQIPETYRSLYEEALSNIPASSNEAELYQQLSNIWKQLGGNKKYCGITKTEWGTIISPYKPQKTKSAKKNVNKRDQQPILPLVEENEIACPPSKPFYCDENAWSYIEPVIPNKDKVRKTIKDDLTWFQDDYNENRNNTNKGKYPHGKYANRSKYPLDNFSVISNYQDYLRYNQTTHNQNMKWKSDAYKGIDIAAIIQQLRKVYL